MYAAAILNMLYEKWLHLKREQFGKGLLSTQSYIRRNSKKVTALNGLEEAFDEEPNLRNMLDSL